MATTTARRAVLLATARVRLEAPNGKSVVVRALLDHAAESSFISEWAAQTLGVSRQRVSIPTSGLQRTHTGEVKTQAIVTLRSPEQRDFSLIVSALILPSLSNLLPSETVEKRHWPHLDGLQLADVEFAKPGRIDAILGADVYGPVVIGNVRHRSPDEPTAMETVFGWIVIGPTGVARPRNKSIPVMHCSVVRLSELLQRFWETEAVSAKIPVSHEYDWCERQFKETHYRESSGRYVVRLPINPYDSIILGNTYHSAMQLLLFTERKLIKQPLLMEKYISFLQEYEELGHMRKISERSSDEAMFYLPHHAVFRNRDQRGKVRVVFNASFRSSTGKSLNDKLLPGPKLQSDLWIILSRWRFFKVAFKADIVKMFRQINVLQDDVDLQRILWRPGPDEELSIFQLMTVTYGTAPAPFLAHRVLLQLAEDESARFPLGAEVIRRHSYVDDIFAGTDDLQHAANLQQQVINIFAAGQYQLDKWATHLS